MRIAEQLRKYEEVLPRQGIERVLQEKQGTKATGLVSDNVNMPPRECWNCVHFREEACYQEDVMKDPEVIVFNEDGSVPVGILWCCDYFRSRGLTEIQKPKVYSEMPDEIG